MQYGNAEPPAVKWDTAHVVGDNLIIHLDRNDPALHMAVISREVIEDATRTSDGPLAAFEAAGEERVGRAIRRAWYRGELRDTWEVGGQSRRNIQLWLTGDDFE